MTHVAALFVEDGGIYAGLGLDMWPESRDARLYDGPYPVVAHPPCGRWCRLAPYVEATHGYKVGDDGGCFESALESVRRYGGVLEHPAYTRAWEAYGLPRPVYGGWQRTLCGGWVAYVEQGRYGHITKKPTWLYAVSDWLPSFDFGFTSDAEAGERWPTAITCLTEYRGDRRASPAHYRARVGKKAAGTPIAFRDILIEIARGV